MQKFLPLPEHGRKCPVRERYDELRRERDCKTDQCKFIQTRLCAALMNYASLLMLCMTGWGIGQLWNYLQFDKKSDEIIMDAGINEIEIPESLEEFVFTVSKAE